VPLAAWDHARHCRALALEVERYVDALTGADLTRPVPSCPDWDLAELVRHIGTVHRWADRMVREGATERLAQRELDLRLPPDPNGLPAWLGSGGEALVATLRAADPDASMWVWGADPHVRFWSRRMLHETTVHRADAELALGRDPAIDADTAADGIDELLDNLPGATYFAPKVAALRGDGESMQFEDTDAGAHWVVRLEPNGFVWTRGRAHASVSVRASVADLLLLLYRRLPAADARFACKGDHAVLARWLDNSAI
jgi:uncharacterized protein (TIGR03083 family)